MYAQVIKPNLKVVGKARWCLTHARNIFGIKAKWPNAWLAWLASHKHKDRNYPKNVAVPVWFKYYLGGINKGHVGVVYKGKFYTSPVLGKSVWGSLAEFEAQVKNVHYVGWSEDINGVAVIKKVAAPKPVVSMPRVGQVVVFKAPVDRTVFVNGTTKVKGYLKFRTDSEYTVRGYDKKYKNRIVINSKSVGNGGTVALYDFNGKRIPGWRIK